MKILAMAGLLAILAPPALAQRSIGERLERQEERIEKGAESGKLTPKEEQKLEQRQEAVEREREAAREDGEVTKGERKDIRRAQDKAGKAIRRQKHDAKGKH